MWRLAGAVAILLSAVACGPGQAAAPVGPHSPATASTPRPPDTRPVGPTLPPLGAATPPRVATPPRGALPTPAPGLLFAVVEARATGDFLGPGVADSPDTVVIVGLDGVARARASFSPRSHVFVGNAASIQGPVARTAAGAVYYADGQGIVRRLSSTGAVATVASFPLTDSQQQLRFAVSPDGRTILATTITFPPKHDPPPQDLTQPFFKEGGRWSVALDRATGGSVDRVYSRDLGDQYPPGAPAVTGWIAAGPVMGTARFGTQQPPLDLLGANELWLSDEAGAAGPALGGAGCTAQSFTASGEVLCTDPIQRNAQVRTMNGAAEWNLPPDCLSPASTMQTMWAISPNGLRVASAANVCSRDGAVIAVPAGFRPQGWLDDDTLIGTVGDPSRNEMAIASLSDPGAPIDLGFQAEFVGVVSPG